MKSSKSMDPVFLLSNCAKRRSPSSPFKGKYWRNVSLSIPLPSERSDRSCHVFLNTWISSVSNFWAAILASLWVLFDELLFPMINPNSEFLPIFPLCFPSLIYFFSLRSRQRRSATLFTTEKYPLTSNTTSNRLRCCGQRLRESRRLCSPTS